MPSSIVLVANITVLALYIQNVRFPFLGVHSLTRQLHIQAIGDGRPSRSDDPYRSVRTSYQIYRLRLTTNFAYAYKTDSHLLVTAPPQSARRRTRVRSPLGVGEPGDEKRTVDDELVAFKGVGSARQLGGRWAIVSWR